MIANISGGLLMWVVHFLAKKIPVSEYGIFGTYLAALMMLPVLPLQMVLAQQTAKALATRREGELSSLLRLAWWGIFAIWLVFSALVLFFQKSVLEHLHIASPVGLWITLPCVLLQLWLPLLWGVLQGQQNFLWLGWSMILNGIGRVGAAAAAVLVFAIAANGMLGGVLTGLVVALVLAGWQTRAVWRTQPTTFDWRGLLTQVSPLLLAFLGFQILFTADTMFVKAFFSEEEAGFYVSAGTLSRALMWMVLPLASVMFPRLVHSAAKAEKTNLMGLALLCTAVLALVGALFLSVLGRFIVRLVFKPEYLEVATAVLPWYAMAMVPLAVANVLLSNLLARPASKLVPALCVFGVAVIYLAALLVALGHFHVQLVAVLKILGLCNLLLLATCAWFDWRARTGGGPR
jgi:O-antigen/teichoic acid export membrane protein